MQNELCREIKKHIESVFEDMQNSIHSDDFYEPEYSCVVNPDDDDSVIVETQNESREFSDFDTFVAAFDRGGFSIDDVYDCAYNLLSRWIDDTGEGFLLSVDETNDAILVHFDGTTRTYKSIEELIAEYLTGVYFDLSSLAVDVHYSSDGGDYDVYHGEENFERFLVELQENLVAGTDYYVTVDEDQSGRTTSFNATYCGRELSNSELDLIRPNLDQFVDEVADSTFGNQCGWYLEPAEEVNEEESEEEAEAE